MMMINLSWEAHWEVQSVAPKGSSGTKGSKKYANAIKNCNEMTGLLGQGH